jgi:hypothetical protein
MLGMIGFDIQSVVIEATPFSLGGPPSWAYAVVHGVLLLGAILCAFPRPPAEGQADEPLRSRFYAAIGLVFPLVYELVRYLIVLGSLIHPSSVVTHVLYYLALFGEVIGLLGFMQLFRARAAQLGMGRLEKWLRMAFRIYIVTGTVSVLVAATFQTIGRRAIAFYWVRHRIDLVTDVVGGFAWCLLLMGCWSLATALRRTALAGNSGESVSR